MPELILSTKLEQKLSVQQIQRLEFLTLSSEEVLDKIKKFQDTNPTLNVSYANSSSSFEGYSENSLQRSSKLDNMGDGTDFHEYSSDTENWIEETRGTYESLHEYLRLQVGCLDNLNDNVEALCYKMITALNDEGIFTVPLEELLTEEECLYKEEALNVLHNLDPLGIAVDSVLHSLVVQSKKLGLDEEEEVIFEDMIYNYLPDIKKNSYTKIARKYKVEESLIEEFHELLTTLNPHPCSGFRSQYNNYIVPDMYVKNKDGELSLFLNKDAQAVLSLDSSYLEMRDELAKSKESKESLQYLNSELTKAKELIEQVDYRNTTFEKVGKVLLEKQRDFFLFGMKHLKPLTLEMVAAEVNVHLTTVSRISTSKYIDTDFGVFALKTLFSNQVKSEDGELSKKAVQEIIKEMIETSIEKLTDQKISDKLKEQGISCARRTVSKYRNAMNIDTSSIR